MTDFHITSPMDSTSQFSKARKAAQEVLTVCFALAVLFGLAIHDSATSILVCASLVGSFQSPYPLLSTSLEDWS